MKKVLAFLLLFVLSFLMSINAFAEKDINYKAEDYKIRSADFTVNAKSAVLIEAETGEILFSQNESEALPPASVTKIMTLLLVMEAIDEGRISLDDTVVISENASSMGGSQVFLKEGEEMSVEELIKCTVIASANDAAVALAEAILGSEEAFVRAMNEKAENLGMLSTRFENTTGLDDTSKNHLTSAMDIAIMSRELIKYPLITKYSSLWQDSIRNGEFTLTNTNRLVRFYDGCNGLKTGSTDKAGFCISAAAKKGGMQLIAVVMGAESRDIRNEIAKNLLDFGFANYALYKQEEAKIGKIPIVSGIVDEVEVYAKPFIAIIDKGAGGKIVKVFDIPEKISAPISSGQRIGQIRYEIDGKKVGVSDLFVKDSVSEIGFFDIFTRILKTVALGG